MRIPIRESSSGITPACAGKSAPNTRVVPAPWNYPRLRGEESLDELVVKADKELPPLARGRESRSRYQVSISGITPACAGKRPAGPLKAPYLRNYPRLRGEEAVKLGLEVDDWELPPLARLARWPAIDGITPACAGKSLAGRVRAG